MDHTLLSTVMSAAFAALLVVVPATWRLATKVSLIEQGLQYAREGLETEVKTRAELALAVARIDTQLAIIITEVRIIRQISEHDTERR